MIAHDLDSAEAYVELQAHRHAAARRCRPWWDEVRFGSWNGWRWRPVFAPRVDRSRTLFDFLVFERARRLVAGGAAARSV